MGAAVQGQQPPLVDQQGRGALGDPVGRGEVGRGADGPGHSVVADVGPLEEPQPGLEPQDPQDRLVETRLGELPVLYGLQDGVPRHVQGGRVEELVDTGLEGEDGDAVVAVLGADALHAEGVRDHDPVVAEFAAQDAGEDRVGEGGRVARVVERRELDVRGHDRVDAGADRGPEGHGVQLLPQLPAVGDDREAVVAVDRGVPVSREVLGGRGDPGPWYPATSAATSPATAWGSAPKERTPMTGLAGLTLTSATGSSSAGRRSL